MDTRVLLVLKAQSVEHGIHFRGVDWAEHVKGITRLIGHSWVSLKRETHFYYNLNSSLQIQWGIILLWNLQRCPALREWLSWLNLLCLAELPWIWEPQAEFLCSTVHQPNATTSMSCRTKYNTNSGFISSIIPLHTCSTVSTTWRETSK